MKTTVSAEVVVTKNLDKEGKQTYPKSCPRCISLSANLYLSRPPTEMSDYHQNLEGYISITFGIRNKVLLTIGTDTIHRISGRQTDKSYILFPLPGGGPSLTIKYSD